MQISSKDRIKFWHKCNVAIFIIQIAFVLSVISYMYLSDLASLPRINILNISVDCFALFLSSIIFISCTRAKIVDKTTAVFMAMIVVCFFFNYLDIIYWLINGKPQYATINFVISTFYYCCPIVLTAMFWYFICAWTGKNPKYEKIGTVVINTFTVVAFILIIGNIFEKYYFTIDNGVYVRNQDTYYLSIILPTAMLFVCLFNIFFRDFSLTNKLILISYPLIPYISFVLTGSKLGISFQTVFTFISVFIMYTNIFVNRERELEKKQKELAESKINALLLQINPHFIYNTLGSIASLCIEDGNKAREMLYSFSSYLRNNFGELSQKSLVPFKTEIDHLMNYIDIEKQRFHDIQFVCDFSCQDFLIPSLTLQPLVENAITHGIMGRESSGSVTINSFEDESYYHVIVKDDGVGFDPDKPKKDGKNHIGVQNVTTRLDMLCDGKLLIDSTIGVGTTCEVLIPKKGKQQ